jgi:hypothetical protein
VTPQQEPRGRDQNATRSADLPFTPVLFSADARHNSASSARSRLSELPECTQHCAIQPYVLAIRHHKFSVIWFGQSLCSKYAYIFWVSRSDPAMTGSPQRFEPRVRKYSEFQRLLNGSNGHGTTLVFCSKLEWTFCGLGLRRTDEAESNPSRS